MPLPTNQLTDLRGRRKVHSQRIAELRKQIGFLQKEIEVHETIVSLLTNTKVLSALNELYEDQQTAKSFTGREKSFLKRTGVELPRGSHVAISEGADGSLRVRLDVSNSSGLPYTLEWDSKAGFGPAIHTETQTDQ
jgi:hypothetical protein